MTGGLFIALYDDESLKLYLDKGVYGFLMPPVKLDSPSSRSRHYHILADYACSREGTDIFFFLKRKIVYGGKVYGNRNAGSFYLNGSTSPLGRAANADLFWDESVRSRYFKAEDPGVFRITQHGGEKSQPFMFQFMQNEDSGKYILSDDLYFELGKYPYPLPSNSMQGMGFCTLTPGEVTILHDLISKSNQKIKFEGEGEVDKTGEGTLFDSNLVSVNDRLVNEAQLEFTILSSIEPFADFLQDEYVLCRQVPISPFKPSEMDRADICLYSLFHPIKNGTIPNIIIELKKDTGNKAAYEQVERYLKWIKNITTSDEYSRVKAYIIAPRISRIKASSVSEEYKDKISMYSIGTRSFVSLV
jgi:hypothetical protein